MSSTPTKKEEKENIIYLLSVIGMIWFISHFIYYIITESFVSFTQVIGLLLLFSVYRNQRNIKKNKDTPKNNKDLVLVEQLLFDCSNCDEDNRRKLCFKNTSLHTITNLCIQATLGKENQPIMFNINSDTLPKQTTYTEAQGTRDELTLHKICYSYTNFNKSTVSVEYDFSTRSYNTDLALTSDTKQVKSTSDLKTTKQNKWVTRIAFTYFILSVTFTALLMLFGK